MSKSYYFRNITHELNTCRWTNDENHISIMNMNATEGYLVLDTEDAFNTIYVVNDNNPVPLINHTSLMELCVIIPSRTDYYGNSSYENTANIQFGYITYGGRKTTADWTFRGFDMTSFSTFCDGIAQCINLSTYPYNEVNVLVCYKKIISTLTNIGDSIPDIYKSWEVNMFWFFEGNDPAADKVVTI